MDKKKNFLKKDLTTGRKGFTIFLLAMGPARKKPRTEQTQGKDKTQATELVHSSADPALQKHQPGSQANSHEMSKAALPIVEPGKQNTESVLPSADVGPRKHRWRSRRRKHEMSKGVAPVVEPSGQTREAVSSKADFPLRRRSSGSHKTRRETTMAISRIGEAGVGLNEKQGSKVKRKQTWAIVGKYGGLFKSTTIFSRDEKYFAPFFCRVLTFK